MAGQIAPSLEVDRSAAREHHRIPVFDYANVDAIVTGAREHHLRVVLLWFGTWKNGNMHYVPAWVKVDTAKYPRIIRPDGEPIEVLSPLSLSLATL